MATDEERKADAAKEDRCPKCKKQYHWSDVVNTRSMDVYGRCVACDDAYWAEKMAGPDE